LFTPCTVMVGPTYVLFKQLWTQLNQITSLWHTFDMCGRFSQLTFGNVIRFTTGCHLQNATDSKLY
jgi:hypothetical protein